MAELSVGTRLTYIGLWALADDDGYLVLRSTKDAVTGVLSVDVQEIAGDLFRHESKRARENRVREAIEALIERGRVLILDCGRHAVVPSVPVWRVKSGVMLYTVRKRHDAECSLALSSPKEGLDSGSVSDSVSDSVRDRRQGGAVAPSRGARPLSEIVPDMAARFGKASHD